MSRVPTLDMPVLQMSGVRSPDVSTASTADSMRSAAWGWFSD